MSRTLSMLTAAALAVSAAGPVFAQQAGNDLQQGLGIGKVLKVQLGIKKPLVPGVCPNNAEAQLWVFTDFLGKVNVMLARQDGTVAGPITLQTQKASNGQFMATYSGNIPIAQSMNTSYRAVVPSKNGPVTSNSVQLKYECVIS